MPDNLGKFVYGFFCGGLQRSFGNSLRKMIDKSIERQIEQRVFNVMRVKVEDSINSRSSIDGPGRFELIYRLLYFLPVFFGVSIDTPQGSRQSTLSYPFVVCR